jgi:hypothetical protein
LDVDRRFRDAYCPDDGGSIIIMSILPSGTYVVYKSSPAFSAPGNKPEITPAVLDGGSMHL